MNAGRPSTFSRKHTLTSKGSRRVYDQLIGLSHDIVELNRAIPKMAEFLCQQDKMNSILITGQSGIGKSILVDMVLSECLKRFGKEAITFDCSAIEPNLIRSELFGSLKGAFTGSLKNRTGLLKEANGKILHLDEIGNISPDIQKALLIALEGRQILPIGGSYSLNGYKANFGLITSTNKDIRNSSGFADDLYYRISLWPINIPSLSERKIDTISLICDILYKHNILVGKNDLRCRLADLYVLTVYDWKSGGYRELEQEILNLARTAKLSDDLLKKFDNKTRFEPNYDKSTPIEKIIHELGEPNGRVVAARNLIDLSYKYHDEKLEFKFRFDKGLLDFTTITRTVFYLNWPGQAAQLSSRWLYSAIQESQIYLSPITVQELILKEVEYYANNLPDKMADPRKHFNVDLFFMGLLSPYQNLKPNRYIPYTCFNLISDERKDLNYEVNQIQTYKFPSTTNGKFVTSSYGQTQMHIEGDDQKTLNSFLTKYSCSDMISDLKKLVLQQKEINQLTWKEIQVKHKLDRRSLKGK